MTRSARFGAVAVAAVLLGATLTAGVHATERAACLDRADGAGLEASFGFFDGCQALIDGEWRPLFPYPPAGR